MATDSYEDAGSALPATITGITIQKKNKERYSIFADGNFLLGVHEQTLLAFNLKEGVEITPSLFKKLQREEGRFAIKSYLMGLLSRRDHSRQELMNKALQKDYAPETITGVLDELQEKGYIDDTEFALKYASEKSRKNNWGPAKVKAHLYKKGIKRQNIEKSVRKAFEGADFEETFIHLISKRKRRFLKEEHPLKRKKKVIDHLARKGYSPSSIYNCIDKLMKLLEKDE
ncbi:RecX family transcriptional regulator [Aliifodinibius salicampi]|uniref:Regulatory protein RecX n=1 Tax=Fodinibius salicampi TaxID=1920655 RepID=A0ABT3Q1S4_9BACT|nr:RecX family transcriptional regulator [Fodinibius salicampi]MCW9714070.1 RecX family transcriptional regulator [Fodinibius salicampi]